MRLRGYGSVLQKSSQIRGHRPSRRIAVIRLLGHRLDDDRRQGARNGRIHSARARRWVTGNLTQMTRLFRRWHDDQPLRRSLDLRFDALHLMGTASPSLAGLLLQSLDLLLLLLNRLLELNCVKS